MPDQGPYGPTETAAAHGSWVEVLRAQIQEAAANLTWEGTTVTGRSNLTTDDQLGAWI